MKLVSFVIPCYNSEKYIGNVIREIEEKFDTMSDYDYEVIAIDDCSPDNVFGVLRRINSNNPKVKAVRFTKNFGQHSALLAGIRMSAGDFVVTIDDDGQCPIDYVDQLIKPLEGSYDIAFAGYGKKAQSFFKNVGSIFNEHTTNILTDKPEEVQLSNFMAFTRIIADEVKKYTGPYPFLSGLLFRSGKRIINVPLKERHRIEGSSNYNFCKMVALWVTGFTAFTIKPLRLATFLGGIVALIGFVGGCVLIYRRLIAETVVDGWYSVMVTMLVLGGMILFVLGIIGEYVGRIYMTVNNTPQYVVAERIGITEK